MEDLIGIIIMILFAGLSLAGKAAQKRGQQQTGQPKWPGPAAGPKPGTWPQPPGWSPSGWPSAPSKAPSPAPPAPRMQRTASPQPVGWGEGVSLEGSQRSTQGPAGVDSLEAEMSQFERQTNEVSSRRLDMPEASFKSLGSLHGDLEEAPPLEVAEDESRAAGAGLSSLLATPDAAAQGIVLAEVLGRPRALRRDRRYK